MSKAITHKDVTVDVAIPALAYHGFSFRNTTGAPIVVAVYDGTSISGLLLDSIALAAGESARETYPHPIYLGTHSVFVDWTTGIVGGVRVYL